MESTYKLQTERFSGPMEKLLELIEAREMNINKVNLSEVTADFLAYLENLKQIEQKHNNLLLHRTISDFIVIASRLLLIKSKTLLPQLELTKEEETDIADLEDRLRVYKEMKEASLKLEQVWTNHQRVFTRELFKNRPPLFYPPHDLKKDTLHTLAKKITSMMIEVMEEENLPPQKIISLKEKVQELLSRISESGEISLNSTIKQSSKAEIVAFFLAVLHLLRDKVIDIEQESNFSDVIIRKKS